MCWRKIAEGIPDKVVRRTAIVKAVFNKNVHQRHDTVCGMFVMMMFDAVVEGVKFDSYCSRRLTDAYALRMRKKFFFEILALDDNKMPGLQAKRGWGEDK